MGKTAVSGSVLANRETAPLPVAVYNMLSFEQFSWGPLAAAALIVTLPVLPQPFDHVATRPVGSDALVHFEGRQYSVPFAYLGQHVEIRGAILENGLLDVDLVRQTTDSMKRGQSPNEKNNSYVPFLT